MDLLKQRSLLFSFSQEDCELFHQHAKLRRYRRGTIIYEQENTGATSYLIVSGWVQTFYTSVSGKKITIGLWTKDDMIGAPDMDCERRLLTAQAVKDAELQALSKSDVEFLLSNIPQFSRNLIAALSFKARWATNIYDQLATESVLARVAQMVLILANQHGTEDVHGKLVIQGLTHQDIADLVGSSRPSTSLSLKKLEQMGLIEVSLRSIRILDGENLYERSYEGLL